MNALQSELGRPHRRQNALTGDWIAVSPQRVQRPWQGHTESAARPAASRYDPGCYLCPGNARVGGVHNPPYTSTFVFTNDFPAFVPDAPPIAPGDPLLRAEALPGTCRVLCYSPRHDLSLGELPLPQIEAVVDLWSQQTAELRARWRWVQLFENRGELMGSSNPHPHGQVWAVDVLPNEPARELLRQRDWLKAHGRPLLADYAELELVRGERVVAANERWLAVVPWWATWPFETLLLPRAPASSLDGLDSRARSDLASLLKQLLGAYDRVFDAPFPYSMGWHGAPRDVRPEDGWTLHAHLYPPLLRSATVRKFFAGYELLAEPQRDVTPELAAERLRSLVR
jgi:UDPglucose--hexose-1-phosphate uridylyltransferase